MTSSKRWKDLLGRLVRNLALAGYGTVVPLFAQSDLDLMQKPILSVGEARSMMFSFVERNLTSIELPSTLEEWEAKKPSLLKQIKNIVGLQELDERGPIKWLSKGLLDREDYTIEKVIYETYPGMMVPALVYTPKGLATPAPAMVNIPGHVYCEGKAHVDAQARSVNLVRRGVVVITYDYLMTFERNTGANPCGSMPYGGGNDHGLSTFSYTAGTPTALETLDAIRAVDYLYTRKDIDRSRIGVTGESGGSNSTYWVAALDARVRLAVPVCSVTSFDYWIRNDRNWDWHQRPSGIRRIADISTLLALFAPRPLLVITALRGTDSEEFPFDETQEAVAQATKIYRLYGSEAQISLWESKTAHGYQQDKRERMYSWVEQYFLGRPIESAAESHFLYETRTALVCGLPQANKTFDDIYREWIDRPARLPSVPQDQASRLQIQQRLGKHLQELLGLPAQDTKPVLSVQKVSSRSDKIVKQLVFETEPGVRLPAVEFSLINRKPSGTVLFLGRSKDSAPAIPLLLAEGLRAVFVDLRGVGEIDSGGGRTDNWAWFMGRPWTGLWVEDVNAIVAALSTEYGNMPIGVIGTGRLAKPALFAAALNPKITTLIASLPDISYRHEAQKGRVADVPKILAITDLPAIVALVAPRSCWLQFPEGTDERELQSTYASSGEVYQHVAGYSPALRLGLVGDKSWNDKAKWLAQHLRKNV
jgi:hypothetical protein